MLVHLNDIYLVVCLREHCVHTFKRFLNVVRGELLFFFFFYNLGKEVLFVGELRRKRGEFIERKFAMCVIVQSSLEVSVDGSFLDQLSCIIFWLMLALSARHGLHIFFIYMHFSFMCQHAKSCPLRTVRQENVQDFRRPFKWYRCLLIYLW